MKKIQCCLLTSLVLITTNLLADKNCVPFAVTNNLEKTIFIQYDKTQVGICKVPFLIGPGETSQFSIRKEMQPIYLSFRTNYQKLRYDLFASFNITKDNERIIHEEVLTPVAAYSWSDDNSAIYLCLATRYEQTGSCR
jgi:hypothetical protein